jgi:hypothetical protein
VTGKLATVLGPSRIVAMPRYTASVPMVTASEGSPSRVTSRPLTAPAASPTTAISTNMAIIGQCLAHR